MTRFIPHPDRRPAIVTGASSGIGLATARALAARGHPVVLRARRLADRGSIPSFVARAVDTVGPIDILVSGAGQNLPDSTVDATPGAFAALLAVNVIGAHEIVGLVSPGMVH